MRRHNLDRGRIFGTAILFAALGVSPGLNAAELPDPSDKEFDNQFYRPADRLKEIREGSLWEKEDVSGRDPRVGPKQSKKNYAFEFNSEVHCRFTKAGKDKNGKTPKFDCEITKVVHPNGEVAARPDVEDEAKVKFGPTNGEVFAEVAATRLLWMLGFHADAMFPVRVICADCPQDPNRGSGPVGEWRFDLAAIERKLSGKTMYDFGQTDDQGWSWKELESASGASRAEKDGLKLMAAFLQHGDNKPEQQRLSCKDVEVDDATTPYVTTCGESHLLMQDIGATFGGAGWTTNGKTAKMNLQKWAAKKVWKRAGDAANGPKACSARLKKSLSAKDGLGDPDISEEGRRFVASLLCQVSDQQIRDLYEITRVDQMRDRPDGNGNIGQWVETFKRKREEIAAARCDWRGTAPDAQTEEGRMLTSMPSTNYCTAPLW